jgi:hypothetical protein
MLGIDVANKVVCFGANNETIFQGLKTNIICPTHEQSQPLHCWHISLYGTLMQLGCLDFFILVSSCKD